MYAQAKNVAIVPTNPSTGSSLGALMGHLESLVHRGAITLMPKLVSGAPNAKLLEAADLTTSCRYSEKMHAAVEVRNY